MFETQHDWMATAVDWLDAYRARDIDAILELFSPHASIECSCKGQDTISGREAMKAYWAQRIIDYPVAELHDLQPESEGAAVTYHSRAGLVQAILLFNTEGEIIAQRCGPYRSEQTKHS